MFLRSTSEGFASTASSPLRNGTDQQSNAVDVVTIAGVVQGIVPVRVLDRRITVCGSRKQIETTVLQQIRNNRGTPVATREM